MTASSAASRTAGCLQPLGTDNARHQEVVKTPPYRWTRHLSRHQEDGHCTLCLYGKQERIDHRKKDLNKIVFFIYSPLRFVPHQWWAMKEYQYVANSTIERFLTCSFAGICRIDKHDKEPFPNLHQTHQSPPWHPHR